MNQSYRLVWNEASGTWVAVAETTRGRGKRVSGSVLFAAAVSVLGLHAAPALANPPSALQLPVGAQVVAGSASLSQSAASLTITQSSNRAAVDWASFDVGSQARVIFNQPDASSVTLNRVQGSNPSQIFGQISATGQVFLSNPAGVYFGPGSSVDVAGLVATTHGINNTDFMAGSNHFERSGASGSVVNQGQLHAGLGGYIALLAPEVRNGGVIVAQLGTVALAAGEAYTLQFDGNHLSGIVVTPATIATLVDNAQAVQAPGGLIILSAQAANQLQGSVVNNSGTLEARGLALHNGRIVLDAGVGGTLKVAGTLDASNASGRGGDIQITGNTIALTSGAQLDASGSTGGGSVLVGGDWQGSGALQQAGVVDMQLGAHIDASATQDGAGGKVVLWSDVHNTAGGTRVQGQINAQGAGGGIGGQVETSGHVLDVDASQVNAGAGGQWLLDPFNVTIGNGGGDSAGSVTGGIWTPSATGSTIANTTINAALNAGQSVTVSTSGGGGAEAGDITVNGAISKTGGAAASLTLTADSNIALNADILSNAAGGAMALNLNALTGAVSGAGNISSNGGLLTINAAGAGTLSGIISGGVSTASPGIAALTKIGAGTTTLTGANSYTGTTTISAGSLQVGSGSTTGTLGTGAVTDNANLTINRSNNITVANAISGTGSLAQAGTGTTSLTGANSYSGATTISAGTLQVGNGAGTGTLGTGAITDNANLTFNHNIATTVANDISGTGNLTQAGAGTTTLTGTNTYSGTTTITINTGPLQVGNGGTTGSLGTGAVTANANLIINRSDAITVANSISGTGSLSKLGGGTTTLTGDNSYSGTTTINSGTLQVGSGGITGTLGTGAVTANTNLTINRSDALTLSQAISGTGSLTQAGAGTTTLTGANSYSGTTTISTGVLQVGNGSTSGTLGSGAIVDNANLTVNHSDAVTVAGAISGSGGLTQAGAGTTTLTGANSYTGSTTVQAGTLQVGNGGASGSLGTGAVVDNANLVYNLVANTTLPGGNTITGTGNLSSSITGTLTTNNTINLGGAVNLAATGDLNVAAALTYGADSSLTSSAGNLLINGAVSKTAAGATTLNLNATAPGKSISLFADVKDSSASSSTLNINTTTLYNSAGSTSRTLKASNLQLNFSAMAQANFGYVTFDGDSWLHQDLTTSALSCCGTSRIITFTGKLNSDSATTARSFTTTYQNVLSFGADVGGVFRLKNFVSPGSISAMAGNLYTDGTVAISTNEAANLAFFGIPGYGLNLTKTGTTLIDSNNHDVSLLDLQATGSGARDLSINAGSGNVTLGSALYTTAKVLPGNVTVSGQNITVTGAITKTDAANSSLSLTASNSVNINAAITASGAGQLATTLSAGSGTASGAVNGSASGAINTNGGLLTINQGGATGNGTLAGVVSGSGGLTVTGPGSTTLTGANSYTGTTTISAGTLQVGNGGSSGSLGTGAVADNANLVYNLAANTALPAGNTITGSGNLSSSITGTLTTNNSITLGGTVNLQATGDITVAAAESSGGASTFNSTAGSVNLNANTGTTGAGAALLVKAAGDIVQAASTTVQTNGGTITYNANSSGTGGAIGLNSGAGISSQGGNIALGGGTAGDGSGVALGDASNINGISAVSTSIDAGGGNLSLRGTGFAGTGNANNGVSLSGGSISTTGTGNITVLGTGGAGTGTSGSNVGVQLSGSITGGSTGTTTVTGTGGAGPGTSNYGVSVSGTNNTITSTGGAVLVSGQGGGTGSSSNNYGVLVTGANASITAGGSGGVTVQGTGGASTGNSNFGVFVTGASSMITSSGGDVSVTGTGGGTGASASDVGVTLSAGGTVTSGGSGNVSVTGTGGDAGGTGSSHIGVNIFTAGVITAGGSGSVTVQGTGGASSGNSNYGVGINNANSKVTSTSGAVSVTGTGGGAGVSGFNTGVQVGNTAQITSGSNGNVNVTAQGGSGSGGGQLGIALQAAGLVTASGTGTVSVQGTGGVSAGTSTNNWGVFVQGANSQISSSGGAVNVTAQGGSGAGNGNFGFNSDTGGAIRTAGNAPITLTTDSYGTDGNESINAGTGTVTIQNRSTGTLVNLGGSDVVSGGPLLLGLSSSELNHITAGTLVIGRNDGTPSGNVTVSGSVSPSLAPNVSVLTGGNITINAGLGATTQLTLTPGSGATVSGSGNLATPSLLLNGAGASYTLNTASGNAVGTLAASGVGTIGFTNNSALAIGTVGASNGISASGTVAIATASGDLNLTQAISTTNTSANAVLLNAGQSTAAGTATGGNLLVSGAGTVSTGAGGRATLMSGAVAGSTGLVTVAGGSGSGHFRYGSDETTTAYTSPLGSGSYAVYREQPTASVTANSQTLGYGAAITLDASVSGLLNGDALAAGSVSVLGASYSGSGHLNASATPYALGLDVSSLSGLGYQLVANNTGTLTILAKTLTLSGITAASKPYDSNTTATVSIAGVNLVAVGMLAGDNLSLSSTGDFSDKNVGTAKTVTLSNTLIGSDLANYSLAGQTSTTANITARTLTLSGITAASKPYDGNTTASVSTAGVNLVSGGMVSGDNLSLSSTGDFSDKNVGTAKTVSLSNVLTGSDLANYSVTDQASTTANITAKALTLSGITATSKPYDGNTTASVSTAGVNLVSGGMVSGDNLSLSSTGDFSDKNVGTAKTVSLSNVLTGSDLANYTVTDQASTSANITSKALTLSGITAASRPYNGSTSATVSIAGVDLVADGMVAGDNLSLVSTGSFADKNVGTAKVVNLSNTLSGSDLGNYTVTNQATTAANISQATLNVSAPTVSKTYDALVGASGSATVAPLAGAAAGEVVNTPATLAYTDKNAGLANKTVQASGLTIRDSGGADVTANYAISYIDNTASTITPKVLDVSGSRVYDGSASVAANALATSATVGGETLGLAGSGLAIDKNVGTAKALALGTLALVDGTGLASNYTLVGGNDTVSITPRPLSLTGSTGIGKTYDGTTSMPLGVNGYGSLAGGVVSGDALAVSGSPVFSSANTGPRTIGVGSVGLAGADRLNYTLGWSDGSGTITPAALTMTANAAAKVVFDTDPSFSAHYDGFVNGETASVLTHPTVTRPRLGLDESAGSYANALVPSASSSNYTITPVAASFTIAPVGQLLITVADGTKVYGDALPSLGALSARYCPLSGCVGASSIRTVPLVHGSGNSYTFDDGYGTTGSFLVNTTASSTTPVGNIPITVANFAASILTNFSTQTSMEGTLTITQRPVTPTANNVTKVYDGLLTLPATLLGLGNRVGSDNLSFSGSGVLADKNVGSNKAYIYGNLGLLGPDSGNYYLSSNTFSASNASVTPRPLTVTGSSAADKVYDATPFTSGVAGTLQGLVGTETLLASVNYAQFNDAHAGSNKAVTLHYALADGSGLASNYSVADGASTANISRRPVNVAANAQSKNVGQSDPTLTYATEAATGGTGLVRGEQLAGMLDRDPGEAVGAYRINQGSLNNANNPDYAVAFQSAQLAIHAIPTTPTPAVSPTPPQPAAVASPLPALVYPPDPIPESRNTSEGGSRAMLDPGNSRQGIEGTLSEPGILVALVSQPQRQADGLIVVEVPGRLVDESRSLNFALPPSVADNLAPLAPLRITTLDGQDMPAWLRYDTNSRHFVATRVPRGALPLQLLLESSGKRWLIQVTQRSSV